MGRASFTGSYPMKIDGKGRMSIPPQFRAVLQHRDPDYRDAVARGEDKLQPAFQVVFGPHLEDHLEAYTIDAFDDITERIESLDFGSQERELATAAILGESQRIELMDGGRIILPKDIRDRAGYDPEAGEELMLVGAGNHFKIFTASASVARQEQTRERLAAIGNPMALLNGPKGRDS